MRDIAVGRAITRGYGFLFGQLGSVLALGWVAALFYAGLRLWLLRARTLNVTSPFLPAPLLHAAINLAFLLATILLTSALAIAMTRAALGYSRSFTLAHFHIGVRELALCSAQLRLYGLLIVLAAAGAMLCEAGYLGAGALLAHYPALAHSGLPVALLSALVLGLLSAFAIAYTYLRVSLLLYPVETMEEGGLLRAWGLGRHQVGALLAIFLATTIPVVLANLVFDVFLFGPALGDAVRALLTQAPAHQSLDMLLASQPEAMTLSAAVSLMVWVALQAGAAAEAFRALTADDYAAARGRQAGPAGPGHAVPAYVPAMALAEAAFHEPAAVYAAARTAAEVPVHDAPAALIGDPFAAQPSPELLPQLLPLPEPAAEPIEPGALAQNLAQNLVTDPVLGLGEAQYQDHIRDLGIETVPAGADLTSHDGAYEVQPAPGPAGIALAAPFSARVASYDEAPGPVAAEAQELPAPAIPVAGPEHESVDLSAMPLDWVRAHAAPPDRSQADPLDIHGLETQAFETQAFETQAFETQAGLAAAAPEHYAAELA